MHKVALHPRSSVAITSYLSNPAHALALIAPLGMGKTYVANHIASALLSISPKDISNYPYVLYLLPDEKNSIKIEPVRSAISTLKLKTTGEKNIRRVIIIEHAETMTTEAQNALLKSLEEPPQDTVILLTISNESLVLPTILSRVQKITLHQPDTASVAAHFNDVPNDTLDKILLLSDGKPGLTRALLDDDTNHPLVAGIRVAKELLGADAFTKLCKIDDIVKAKHAQIITDALVYIAQATLARSSSAANKDTLERWHSVLEAAYTAQQQLARNGQQKLVLTNLFLRIS